MPRFLNNIKYKYHIDLMNRKTWLIKLLRLNLTMVFLLLFSVSEEKRHNMMSGFKRKTNHSFFK